MREETFPLAEECQGGVIGGPLHPTNHLFTIIVHTMVHKSLGETSQKHGMLYSVVPFHSLY